MNTNNAARTVIAAAIQLDTKIGNTTVNLAACERLAIAAVKKGATYIGLPEFFNTGVCWDPSLVDAIETEEGDSAGFLENFSHVHSVVIGGSFMCRIPEGGVRNRYLCFANGELVGRHDKDLPTMWENAFYEPGDASDIGVLGTLGDIRIGAAVCWEFMRTQTARRMRGKVDVIIGGSHWWSMPTHWPSWLVGEAERRNEENTIKCVQETAKLIGAPVIHASHCNTFSCDFLGGWPLTYHGQMEGNTAIIDARGNILARRLKQEGEGLVTAEITLQSIDSTYAIPTKFWLRKRTPLAAAVWHYHGMIGRHWYKRNVVS